MTASIEAPPLVRASRAPIISRALLAFLPLSVDRRASWVVPVALFLQPATGTAARWIAGRHGDRNGHTRLLGPGVALSVVGMATLSVVAMPAAVIAGSALFGAGFGILQNSTSTLMYARVARDDYSTASAIWNGAYDLGMAAGAISAGFLISVTGYPVAFLLTATAMLPSLLLVRQESRDRRVTRSPAVRTATTLTLRPTA